MPLFVDSEDCEGRVIIANNVMLHEWAQYSCMLNLQIYWVESALL